MKLKRAIAIGALLWVLIFFEVSVLMFGFKLQGTNYYLTHYLASAVLVTICTLIYFNKSKPTIKSGFTLGIIFILTGVILDAAITVPLFIKSYSFFLDKFLWLSYLEGLIVTTLIGAVENKI